MYKVMRWMKSCLSENGFAKIEHYFIDSKEALKVYFRASKKYDNIALVITTEHSEFVFMFHYSDDFPKEIRPHTFTQIFTEIKSIDKTPCMYDVYANVCGFTHRTFRFNQDGSTEEI